MLSKAKNVILIMTVPKKQNDRRAVYMNRYSRQRQIYCKERIFMKKTKIVCTLGPATDDDNVLRELIKSGMDCARFNFSHGGS